MKTLELTDDEAKLLRAAFVIGKCIYNRELDTAEGRLMCYFFVSSPLDLKLSVEKKIAEIMAPELKEAVEEQQKRSRALHEEEV